MPHTTITKRRSTDKPCRRCNGTGHVRNSFQGGRCFACDGTGHAFETYEAPMTDAELAAEAEWAEIQAARSAREAARAARRAARAAR